MIKNFDYKFADVEKAFFKLNIRKGDVVYVTGNLLLLGKSDSKFILNDLYKLIKNVIGKKGTIIVPTFSFRLARSNEVYDKKKTISEMGVFSEFIRQKSRYRSDHALTSISALGYEAKYFTQSKFRNTYGIGSPSEKLVNRDAKFISIGLPPNLTCSHVHHAELMANVPYRYIKEFKIYVKKNNSISKKKYYLHVLNKNIFRRHKDRNKKIFKYFLKKNRINKIKIGKSNIFSYSIRNFYESTIELMSKDIYVWLNKLPKQN